MLARCSRLSTNRVSAPTAAQTGGMLETPDELAWLQQLLDDSLAHSSAHLRSIVTPGERTLDAAALVAVLRGMQTISVATTTASGEPRISAVDGHFLHSRWHFTTSGDAVKTGHLRARPATSVSHVRGDDLGVFCHGRAEFLEPGTPERQEVDEHLTAHYGSSPSSWGPDIVYVRVQPTWMVAYAFRPQQLLEAEGISLPGA